MFKTEQGDAVNEAPELLAASDKQAYFFRKPFSGIFWVVAIATSLYAANYFRTYALHGPDPIQRHLMRIRAEATVFDTIKQQLRAVLSSSMPGLSESDRDRAVDEKARELRATETKQFQDAVETTLIAAIQKKYPKGTRTYLLEADPYYYYTFTKNIINTGKLGPPARGSYFHNPLRRLPQGVPERMSWHPYLGFYLYSVMKLFKPDIELMAALSCLSLVIVAFTGAVYFILCRLLKFSVFTAWLSSLVLLLSPVFIQRSLYGWYDTDPYNYLFPITVLICFIYPIKFGRRVWFCSFLAGLATTLYSLFWVGWPFILFLTVGAGIFCGVLLWKGGQSGRYHAFQFIGGYIFFSIVLLIILQTPETMFEQVLDGWKAIRDFSGSEFDVWPSVFATVSEAGNTEWRQLIYLAGNYPTLIMAVIGVGTAIWEILLNKDYRQKCIWATLLAFAVVLCVLALKSQRFTILFTLPLSLMVGLGIETLFAATPRLLKRFTLKPLQVWFQNGVQLLVSLGVTFFMLPLLFANGGIAAHQNLMIMNDTWYDSLIAIRDKTPHNSVVFSWWPPGHFITAIAERRVPVDGGAQHLKETYWIAVAFITEDEALSLGVLRMLNMGGDSAVKYLEEALSWPTSKAINLLMEILPLSSGEAYRKLPADWAENQKQQFLGFTHGKGELPPSYLYVYNDMIEQNLAMTIVARWSFEKAELLRDTAVPDTSISILKNNWGNYVDKMMSVTGSILRYTEAAKLVKEENGRMFFANGIQIEKPTMDCLIDLPERNIYGRPKSIFYMHGGELTEKVNSGTVLEASVLYLERNEQPSTLIASPELVRSILFRLFYLDAEGLKFIKPMYQKDDMEGQTKTKITVHEVDWEAFKRAEMLLEMSEPVNHGGSV